MAGIRLNPLNQLTARSYDSDEAILVVTENASPEDAEAVRVALGVGTTDSPTFDGLTVTGPSYFQDGSFGTVETTSLFFEDYQAANEATFIYNGTSASDHRIALGGVADGSTGATLFGAATAAAARTTLGLATTDSPTFAGVTASGSVTTSSGSFSITSATGTFSQSTGTSDRIITASTRSIIRNLAGGGIDVRNHSDTAGIVTCGNLTASGTIQTGGYLFANLPTPTTGMRAYITNGAAAPIYMANAAGGGAVYTPVFYNGTNWINA